MEHAEGHGIQMLMNYVELAVFNDLKNWPVKKKHHHSVLTQSS